MTNVTKITFQRPETTFEYATQQYVNDNLTLIASKTQLPITQLLRILRDNQIETIACSCGDHSFFAAMQRNKIAVTIKELGKQTIEFEIPADKIVLTH